MSAAFYRFPDFPPELRNAVWRAALPDEVGPTLFFYRSRGYWVVGRLDESDPDFIAVDGELEMQFRTDLLSDDNQFHVPLVFVNREARSLALSWLDEQGIRIKTTQPKQYIFTRPFDCQSDVLYIADDKFGDFCTEPYDRQNEPDTLDRQITIPTILNKFAVSERIFMQRDRIRWLPDIETWMEIRTIFVVVGPQPDGEPGPWRWKLEAADAGAFVWNREKQDFDFCRGVGITSDEDVYKRIGEAARVNLSEHLLTWMRTKSLEIRPVTIARTR